MQGIFISGARPKSKKEVKEAAASNPDSIRIEATSLFGNEYDGPAPNMPEGEIAFVGPDPSTRRNFYGTIKRSGEKLTVT